ncbi:Wzz/FepE/Etk N-terminal domain-containing protein [Photobacterium aphoticum]|uniref:Chain-length determining protein n=1 Tax=Photobacterium aphoticum TaxID=754436 RepID=A0A0J1GH54_9GAMM|nr:Wzz/FepE/Etk N-terminal domain-containing protein [Photobacterium aphoticum]KLU98890.1 hypothetical protein ABT58_20325 [Photobacterium aphoticum]PSU56667.1 hypothetical protein C9I90_12095 [Photobacterium aphoticum]GHA39068.1 hypothetical protein GCM10007086_10760 [Photobacterium aphoticum]
MNNKTPQHDLALHAQQSNMAVPYPPHYQNDEIDLVELVKTLWQGKLTILLSTVLCGLIAVGYALWAPEVWTAKARIIEAKTNDYTELSTTVNAFTPVFTNDNENESQANISAILIKEVQASTLFHHFIDAYNSSINKEHFLTQNALFQNYVAEKKLNDEAITRALHDWSENISATSNAKRGTKADFYTLSFNSYSQETSYQLLKAYSSYIHNLVNNETISSINSIINGYTRELTAQYDMLSNKAQRSLMLEKSKASIALQITANAQLKQPLANYNNNNDLFDVALGENANKAKLDALNNLKDLTLFEPDLITVTSKLDFLSKNTGIDKDIHFQSVRYIDEIAMPLSRDKPKRALITVLGVLLGGMLGVAIVLIRHTVRKYNA